MATGYEDSNDENLQQKFRTPNAIINQETDKDFIRLTIKIPGLKVKRQMNLSKVPKNGRLIDAEYRKNNVSLTFVLNEGRSDEQTFHYSCKEPFKGNIEQEKSKIKFDDNTIRWLLHKTEKW